jgi:hypothetical protein
LSAQSQSAARLQPQLGTAIIVIITMATIIIRTATMGTTTTIVTSMRTTRTIVIITITTGTAGTRNFFCAASL